MIQKEFIPYEQALLLKELGFDEPCFMNYFNYTNTSGEENIIELQKAKDIIFGENYFFKNFVDNTQNENPNSVTNHNCSAPTFSQAFRWFREEYKLHSRIRHQNGFYWYEIEDYGGDYVKKYNTTSDLINEWDIYEEAELECLRKLIEIVKQKL